MFCKILLQKNKTSSSPILEKYCFYITVYSSLLSSDMFFSVLVKAESTSGTNESVLKVALDHGKASGVIKSHDRVVVCQKVGDASVVKIIELED